MKAREKKIFSLSASCLSLSHFTPRKEKQKKKKKATEKQNGSYASPGCCCCCSAPPCHSAALFSGAGELFLLLKERRRDGERDKGKKEIELEPKYDEVKKGNDQHSRNRAPLPLSSLGCLSLTRCGCGTILASRWNRMKR